MKIMKGNVAVTEIGCFDDGEKENPIILKGGSKIELELNTFVSSDGDQVYVPVDIVNSIKRTFKSVEKDITGSVYKKSDNIFLPCEKTSIIKNTLDFNNMVIKNTISIVVDGKEYTPGAVCSNIYASSEKVQDDLASVGIVSKVSAEQSGDENSESNFIIK